MMAARRPSILPTLLAALSTSHALRIGTLRVPAIPAAPSRPRAGIRLVHETDKLSVSRAALEASKALEASNGASKKRADERVEWSMQWYPVTSTRALRRNEPNTLKLLDLNLVAWRSEEGWRVAADRCPHRGAPLSYGRLERNATLTCSYHGWQFDGKGESAYVPTRAKQGCMACLRMFPTQVSHALHRTLPICAGQHSRHRPISLRWFSLIGPLTWTITSLTAYAHVVTPLSQVCEHGLLWVWPRAAVEGSIEEMAAMAKPLPIDHLPPPSCTVTDWTVNRVPIPWASLLENTLDDAHGVHAHHGFSGLDRAVARPASFTKSGESGKGDQFVAWVNVSGPLVASDVASRADESSTDSAWINSYSFTAPHRTTVRFGPAYRAEGFIVPASYDETLLVSAAFSTPGPGIGGNIMIAAQRANPFLTAALHRLGTTIVCQDAVLAEADGLDDLRGERWTGEKMSGGLTESDGAVVRLRSWMRRSGGPPLQPVHDDVKRWSVRHRLSVWEMHTRDCPTCRRAHADSAATAKALLAISVAAAASGQVPAAITLFMTSEISRQTSLWFEHFDVKFDR